MLYLGTLRLEFKKVIVIVEISTLKFVKNEFLTHTVNFGVEFTFSKVSGLIAINVDTDARSIPERHPHLW